MSKPPENLRRALLDHYDRYGRRLPWRKNTDPYRVLVSEVMLQQTRVETVLKYYGGWLERFPDLESLATAEIDDVLGAWEGLGYYRRARNLHRAAQVIHERRGSLPSSYAELLELPGIGDYTAGALASIVLGQVVPAVDGNVRRVLARLHDVGEPGAAWVRSTAADLVDPERPGDWNQALMELGATVCTTRRPSCGRCPVSAWCSARAAGTQEERPSPVRRRRPRRAMFVLVVLHRGGRVLLQRRPQRGLLAGMWAFPEVEMAADEPDEAEVAAGSLARSLCGRGTGEPERLPACRHAFTHLRATYLPYLVGITSTARRPCFAEGRDDLKWLDASDPDRPALPVAQRRILESARTQLVGGPA